MSFIKETLKSMKEKPVFNDLDACPISITEPDFDCPILLVSGDNATGKSLACRFFREEADRFGAVVKEISMGDRNSKGYMHQVNSFGRYGDEDRESTGFLTFNRIVKDIEKLKSSTEPFLLILDEPDMGMSSAYMRAMGEFLSAEFAHLSSLSSCMGIIVVTHDRTLIQFMANSLGSEPYALMTGVQDQNFWTWLFEEQEQKSISDLLSLSERAKERRKTISNYLKKDS